MKEKHMLWRCCTTIKHYGPVAFDKGGAAFVTCDAPDYLDVHGKIMGSHNLVFWDSATGEKSGERTIMTSWFQPAAIDSRNKLLANIRADGHIELWDFETGNFISMVSAQHDALSPAFFPEAIETVGKRFRPVVAFSSEGNLFAVVSQNDRDHAVLFCWQWEHAHGHLKAPVPVKLFDFSAYGLRTCCSVALSHNFIAYTGDSVSGGVIAAQDLTTGEETVFARDFAVKRNSPEEGSPVALSPDGQLLAAGTGEGTVKIWGVKAREEVMTVNTNFFVTALCFSPDAQILATGNGSYHCTRNPDESLIKLWDVKNGKLICDLRGHLLGIDYLMFSPEGKRLVSASRDGEVKMWKCR